MFRAQKSASEPGPSIIGQHKRRVNPDLQPKRVHFEQLNPRALRHTRRTSPTLTCGVNARAKHITAVKTFILITFLLLVSNVPSGLVGLGIVKIFPLTYFYFINHTCNPLVYITLSKTFRNDVKNIFRKLCAVGP